MRTWDVLPEHEAKRYINPPSLSVAERKKAFQIDDGLQDLLDNSRSDINKIGLLLQNGYFKASSQFFTDDKFRPIEIKFVTKLLGIPYQPKMLQQYDDRTRQNHRRVLLRLYGFKPATEAKGLLRSLVNDMVSKQMHPRKILYIIAERLRQKKIELPSYALLSRLITKAFNQFENGILEQLKAVLTNEHKETLDQLIEKDGRYERSLLTRLKSLLQSYEPKKIQAGVRSYLIIKKIFFEVLPAIEEINLSSEATKYYAEWVAKAKSTQLSQINDPFKQYLYLTTFISHYYRLWQDKLVDVVLKSVRQQLNKSEKMLANIAKERDPEQKRLTESVLTGFKDHKKIVSSVRSVLHNENLASQEKLDLLYSLVPKEETEEVKQIDQDANKLEEHIEDTKSQKDEFNVLDELSRKLQNRVAAVIKHLSFDFAGGDHELNYAICHYQNNKEIKPSSPIGFLDNHEYKAVHAGDKFNVSLYKSILFCKIASAIRSGSLSLKYSYRFLSIDSYLIDKKRWGTEKTKLLDMLGLKEFEDIDVVVGKLKPVLNKQFMDVNRKITKGDNQWVKIKKDGKPSIHTPAVEKPDYDSLVEVIGQDTYVPILKMISQIDSVTKFSSAFKHHNIKGSKAKPSPAFFYAGIFGLGAGITSKKLAGTAKGLNYNTLSNTINWHFSLENLHAVNAMITDTMAKLWLPKKFKKEQALLHTSSDGQKQCVSVESLNANESFKYHGNGKGINIYRFIDERGILFYSSVFTSSERDAAYVIDGLLHNDSIKSDMHSTDTHGYTEMIFAISHLIGVTFAPRIADVAEQNLSCFSGIKHTLEKRKYPLQATYNVKTQRIKSQWDNILRFIATIKLREHRASIIIKRLSSYGKQHPLRTALKDFGRIIKSIFILKYIDDVELRQAIEKQLNKGELANKFASAVSVSDPAVTQSEPVDQEMAAMCKTIIQNIIILWNYIELTKIIMRSDGEKRKELLDNITSASILTWRHVNLLGTYDFSDLDSANDNDLSISELINFKAA